MDIDYIKKLIPLYLDGELDPEEKKEVEEALEASEECRAELRAHQEAWATLTDWEDIEADPAYMSRFWTRVATDVSWPEKVWSNFKEGLSAHKLAPALAAACLVLIVGLFSVLNYMRIHEADVMLANASPEEIEMIENLEFAQNLELIEMLDILEDMELLEQWETQES